MPKTQKLIVPQKKKKIKPKHLSKSVSYLSRYSAANQQILIKVYRQSATLSASLKPKFQHSNTNSCKEKTTKTNSTLVAQATVLTFNIPNERQENINLKLCNKKKITTRFRWIGVQPSGVLLAEALTISFATSYLHTIYQTKLNNYTSLISNSLVFSSSRTLICDPMAASTKQVIPQTKLNQIIQRKRERDVVTVDRW